MIISKVIFKYYAEKFIFVNADYSANPTNIFGQKFFGTSIVEPIQLLIKPEKYETRFYVISKFRIFIVYARSVGNIKIDKSFNILALRQIIINENKVNFKRVLLMSAFL